MCIRDSRQYVGSPFEARPLGQAFVLHDTKPRGERGAAYREIVARREGLLRRSHEVDHAYAPCMPFSGSAAPPTLGAPNGAAPDDWAFHRLSLIHISEPTRL